MKNFQHGTFRTMAVTTARHQPLHGRIITARQQNPLHGSLRGPVSDVFEKEHSHELLDIPVHVEPCVRKYFY